MRTVTLGRTGITTSAAGLGCGGPSRLGTRTDGGDPFNVIRASHERGVTFFDTAESYRTEAVLGDAVKRLGIDRDSVTIATKTTPFRSGPWDRHWSEIPLKGGAELRDNLHASLRRLGTEHIDVFFLHAPLLGTYEQCGDELVPELERLKRDGLVRAIGVTEMFAADTSHEMLGRALDDDWIDMVMVGFNILNQSARESVYRRTREKSVATLNMFSARRALTLPDHLRSTIEKMIEAGDLEPGLINPDDPFDFLQEYDGFTGDLPGPGGVTETAYRFCAQEPGVDVTLFGTGNPDHARLNVDAINMPPLPEPVRKALVERFGAATTASGN